MLLFISASILTLYAVIVSSLRGVQKSLSATYFLFEDKFRRYIFAAVFLGYGITLAIYCDHWLMYVACAFICMVGINPNYKLPNLEPKFHYIGAGGAGLFSQVYLLTLGLWPVVLASCVLMLVLTNRVRNSTWWVEMVAFYTVYIALIYLHLT